MRQPLIIVGIDPGTTVGVAVLDLNGKVVKTFSHREYDLSSLIKDITGFGRVLAVGTDKARVPGFVETFAIKVGAKILSPREDLAFDKKRMLVEDEHSKNSHEFDAIASAMFAYSELLQLLSKIEVTLKKLKKENLAEKVTELVVKKEIPIKLAVEIIETPEEPVIKDIRKSLEKEVPDKSIARLYEKNEALKDELSFLKKRFADVEKLMAHLRNENINMLQREEKILNKRENPVLEHKNQRIRFLEEQLSAKDSAAEAKDAQIEKLYELIGKLKDKVLIKKLETLSFDEFKAKNKLLNICDYDLVYVKRPEIISQNTVSYLKEKNVTLISEKKVKIGMIMLDKNKIPMFETGLFALADAKDIAEEKKKGDVISRIVEDYRNSKIK